MMITIPLKMELGSSVKVIPVDTGISYFSASGEQPKHHKLPHEL